MPDKTKYRAAVYCRLAIEPPTALYCRTAVSSNPLETAGIEAQKHRLLRYAKENGYAHPVLYIDNGESGLTLDRPAFKRLMADVDSGEVKTVIVTSSDRIARSGDLLMEWIFHFKHTGARCLSLEAGGKDIRTESDFLTYMMFSFIPELAARPVMGLNFRLRNNGEDT